ncbi:hypothetical protein [Streptomyces sp. NBC_00120]|nr:hypothetical protein [Streptomyces sp. NBC_00120]MCX5320091.1 hypothetical protein [Streptomyces sp. NBC_00120]
MPQPPVGAREQKVELSFVEGECRSGEVLKALVWIRLAAVQLLPVHQL